MTTPDQALERDILLSALATAQQNEKIARDQARAAARSATATGTRIHELEQQLEQAHRLIAEQTRLIDTLGGRQVAA